MTLASTKMGLHEWAYSNNYDPAQRQKMKHVDLPLRFANMTIEVELGFTPEQTAAEVERCLNCDVQTHFTDSLCIECDACIDICPDGLPDHHRERRRGGPARAADGAGHRAEPGRCSCPAALKQTGRVMVKDENVCVHCGLCAERCPTYAWDMRKFAVD